MGLTLLAKGITGFWLCKSLASLCLLQDGSLAILTAYIFLKRVVPENIHTPPTEGIGISWGGGGFCKANNFKEMYEA